MGLLAVALVAALAARLLVLFVMLPVLTRMRLSEPISARYSLVIGWGGLRGALTLILAMGVAQNAAIPDDARTFISATAAGFALFSLLVNGTTLRGLIRLLGLDRLTRPGTGDTEPGAGAVDAHGGRGACADEQRAARGSATRSPMWRANIGVTSASVLPSLISKAP